MRGWAAAAALIGACVAQRPPTPSPVTPRATGDERPGWQLERPGDDTPRPTDDEWAENTCKLEQLPSAAQEPLPEAPRRFSSSKCPNVFWRCTLGGSIAGQKRVDRLCQELPHRGQQLPPETEQPKESLAGRRAPGDSQYYVGIADCRLLESATDEDFANRAYTHAQDCPRALFDCGNATDLASDERARDECHAAHNHGYEPDSRLTGDAALGARKYRKRRGAGASVPKKPPSERSSGMAKCCDGSLSPTCVCPGHRGCCSHHGGLCGCE